MRVTIHVQFENSNKMEVFLLTKIRNLEEIVERLREENKQLRVVIEQLNDRVAEKDAKINDLERKLDIALAEKDARINDLETRLDIALLSKGHEIMGLKHELEKSNDKNKLLEDQARQAHLTHYRPCKEVARVHLCNLGFSTFVGRPAQAVGSGDKKHFLSPSPK